MARQPSRLYLALDLGGDRVDLDADSAHYLSNVLRLGARDPVIVFDGRGTERSASVESLTRRGAVLALADFLDPLPASPREIVLIQGLIKADRMSTIVQKATELGVARIIAARTDFSVIKLDSGRADRKLEHWQRVAYSACEQSHRHFPPNMETAPSLDAAIGTLPDTACRIALHNHGAATLADLGGASETIAVIVGPEGGFSPAEVDLLNSRDCRMLRLGPRILRAETAAIAACTMAQLLWGDLR